MAKQKKAPGESANPETPPADTAAADGYTVLARRYRPQQFAELAGQEAVAQALVNALKGNRVAHAYLFTGARGVGKTSTARILAKALNCVHGPTPTPCDECPICKSIAAGNDVDVLEIDGASNRGIDDIREVRGNVQYRPSKARYKIYIIDEVHMLSKEAFNALLKTLEEPPPHVKFIFATTEVQKIPVTILSRCQRFDFAGIGTPRIVERLRDIVAGEGLKADDEALELVARRAGGSMRDAQSLLDQLLAFGGDRLTAEQVHSLLGTAGDDRVVELASAALAKNHARALEIVGAVADAGLQLGELIDQLVLYWRDLMVLNCAAGQASDLNFTSRHRETLARQASALSLDTILAGLDVLSGTRARMRLSNHGRVLVEMALVRLGRLDDLVPLAQLAQWVAQGRAGTVAAPAGGRQQTASRPAAVEPPEGVKKKTSGVANGPVALTEETLPAVWQEVLAQAPRMFASDLEKAGNPAISGPNTLVLRFPPRYNAAREYCQEASRVARVEEVLKRVTGQSWQLRIEAISGGVSADPNSGDDTVTQQSRYRRQRAEAEQEPLLKRAIDALGAQIVHMDDEFGAARVARPAAPESTSTEGRQGGSTEGRQGGSTEGRQVGETEEP
jgi:DNA polymerase-3 subunit gamma/tau